MSSSDSDDVPLQSVKEKAEDGEKGSASSRLKKAFGSDVSTDDDMEDPKTTNEENGGKARKRARVDSSDDSADMAKSKPRKKKMSKLEAASLVIESSEDEESRPIEKERKKRKTKKIVKKEKSKSPVDDSSDDEPLMKKKEEKDNKRVEPDSSSVSESDEQPEIAPKQDSPAVKKEETKETSKDSKDSDDTSDTSIDDSHEGTQTKKEKRESAGKKRAEKKSEKKSGKKDQSSEKSSRTTEDASSIRLGRLKKMVILAGLRFNYKKLFDDLSSDKQRVKKLETEMKEKGLEAPFTHDACKAFKLRKEQEAELAELAANEIIDVGAGAKTRVTRSRRAAAAPPAARGGRVRLMESSDSETETRDCAKEETQTGGGGMFAHLRGIVSDDAESD